MGLLHLGGEPKKPPRQARAASHDISSSSCYKCSFVLTHGGSNSALTLACRVESPAGPERGFQWLVCPSLLAMISTAKLWARSGCSMYCLRSGSHSSSPGFVGPPERAHSFAVETIASKD